MMVKGSRQATCGTKAGVVIVGDGEGESTHPPSSPPVFAIAQSFTGHRTRGPAHGVNTFKCSRCWSCLERGSGCMVAMPLEFDLAAPPYRQWAARPNFSKWHCDLVHRVAATLRFGGLPLCPERGLAGPNGAVISTQGVCSVQQSAGESAENPAPPGSTPMLALCREERGDSCPCSRRGAQVRTGQGSQWGRAWKQGVESLPHPKK